MLTHFAQFNSANLKYLIMSKYGFDVITRLAENWRSLSY